MSDRPTAIGVIALVICGLLTTAGCAKPPKPGDPIRGLTAAVPAPRYVFRDRVLQPLHRELFCEANPIPVKWAVWAMGLIDAGIRLPLTWLSEAVRPRVLGALNHAGIEVPGQAGLRE